MKNLCMRRGGAVCPTDRGFQDIKRYSAGASPSRVGASRFVYDDETIFPDFMFTKLDMKII